jgi:hypothetical protein
MPEPSILDARLAEIDRRLRMIQSGLEPVREHEPEPAPGPQPTSRPPEPEDPGLVAPIPLDSRRPVRHLLAGDRDEEIVALTARLGELTTAHERLLAATQDLLIEQADIISRAAPAVSVSAGPFTDTAALQSFRSAVAALPQVQDATVREFVGAERAVLDVQLRTIS